MLRAAAGTSIRTSLDQYFTNYTLATVNRVLGVLRAAVNWGRFQDPPLLSTSPFHRFGVSIKRRDENKRDRRVHRDEQQLLLAACSTMNTAAHKWVGPALHDRIIGAIETLGQGDFSSLAQGLVDHKLGRVLATPPYPRHSPRFL